ncbi:protein EMBRYONIC FLOWER 1 isoform X1 [Cannabis sativa]|nr:protein EMBRYONIC FLOWER 1 isoform X1 [Cannabis sativa]XP_030482596.2 protein EMBRYONIC FLOWER 1 isoform X1 [Cannabis sativa]XP_030482607.2 protein EMBRYONIC FLOWER 1 isoform X1 [Cannabis sativa]XP_030482615.2 protein EMBRYONIC FLOWER 1 isoform X1 [Cannabis sativa]
MMKSTSSVVMEENNPKGTSGTTASKNAGSFVKIDSISIDLDGGIDKSYVGTKCEHFSIRGYVSEIRRQNWKMCWPFALDDKKDNKVESESLLPPLIAPKFKWWSCQSCQQEISSKGTVKDYDNSGTIGSRSNDTPSLMPSLSSSATHDQPNFLQDPSQNIVEKTKFDVNTFTEVNRSGEQIPSYSDKKKVFAADAPKSFTGHKNGLEKDVVRECSRKAFVPPQSDPNMMKEKPKCAAAEAIKPERNRLLELCKHSCRKDDITDVEFPIQKCNSKSSTKMLQTEKENFAAEQHMELTKASGTSVLACLHDEAGNDVNRQTNGLGFQALDECNNGSSGSVQIFAGQNPQDHNIDKSSGLQRKKIRKVRLLTELLCDNGDAKTDHIRTEDSLCNAINNASAGAGMVSVPVGQVSLPENCRDGLGDNKKRKLPQEEELKSTELSSHSNMTKKFKYFKAGEETANAISYSVSKEDSPTGFYLQTGTRSSWSDYRIDRNSVAVKKKNRKNQIIDKHPSLVPTGDTILNQTREQVGFSTKCYTSVNDKVSLKEVKDASSSRGMDKTLMGSSSKERKSSFKKKAKMAEVDDGQAPQFPLNSSLVRKGSAMRNDDVVHTGPVNVSFQQAENACPDVESHLSFGSYLPTQRDKYNKKYTPQVKDGLSSFLSWKECAPVDQIKRTKVDTNYISDSSIPSNKKYTPQVKDGLSSFLSWKEGPVDQIKRTKVDTNYISHSSIPSNSTCAFSHNQVHAEVSNKLTMYNFPVLNEKQRSSTQIEEGYCPLMKQVDIPGASNNPQTIKGKELLAVSRKHADEITHNVSEQGPSDDIPMEIVELMAKNQYERRLDTAESKKSQLEPAKEARNNQIIGYDQVFSTKELRLFEETSEKKNCRARSERKDIGTVRKNVRPSKQQSVDYFSPSNRDQFDIKQKDQKKFSSVHFPSINSGQCSCAQNCKWNGDVVGRGFFQARMQIGACDTCQIDSARKEEAAHFWSSKISHHAPVRHKAPQKTASQSSNLDILSNGPGFLHKGNILDREHELKFLNRNATNLEKHNQNVGSDVFNRRNVEYPFSNKHNGVEPQQNLMGSLDLYSNETIPAMHLLSLMDAGMQSGAAFKTGGNSKFLKRVSPPDHNSKEYSLLDFGVHKKHGDTSEGPLDYYGKKQLSEKSHNLFPVNAKIGTSTSSPHQGKGFERANDFMGQVSFSSRRKEKVQSSSSAAQSRGRRALNSMFASGGFGTSHNANPVHSMEKGSLGASSSMVLPLQLHTTENSREHKFAVPHTSGTFWPPKSTSESTTCSTNKNPADFSSPEAGNEFMIRGEDLKFGPRKRHGLTSADQRKQQRNAKRTTEKERPRH